MPLELNGLDLRLRRRPTQLRVDLDALRDNYRLIRHVAGPAKIMAILKADAYGHGMLPVAHHLADLGIDWFGVAVLEEGIALRHAGIEAPILVLGGLVGYQVKHFLDYHLDLTASSLFKAEQISEVALSLGRQARVHLKIDTGMHRIGVRCENGLDFVKKTYALPNLDVIGLFSHLYAAEESTQAASRQQIADFTQLETHLQALNIRPPILHLANSAGLFLQPNSHFDLVRPGIGLYGCMDPSLATNSDATLSGLRPMMRLESQIVYVKGIRRGWGVSYGHTWHAPNDGWLATIPVGYGDGYPRLLSNRAHVLIGGKRYPIVGQISMDQATVWLNQDRFSIGEEVVLLGEQGQESIGAWELAQHAQSIAYELLCGWTNRVPRIYITDGRERTQVSSRNF
jgi:alanine racemase